MANEDSLEMLLDRLPPEVVETLTAAQRVALMNAIKRHTWRRHPVNIRLSFPLVRSRYFITLVAGPERRSPERLARERRAFPLLTAGNILFLLGVGGASYVAALLGLMIFSSLVSP